MTLMIISDEDDIPVLGFIFEKKVYAILSDGTFHHDKSVSIEFL